MRAPQRPDRSTAAWGLVAHRFRQRRAQFRCNYGFQRSVAAIAGQPSGLNQLLFSRISDSDNLYTGVVLVNSSPTAVNAEITFSGVSGASRGQKYINWAGHENHQPDQRYHPGGRKTERRRIDSNVSAVVWGGNRRFTRWAIPDGCAAAAPAKRLRRVERRHRASDYFDRRTGNAGPPGSEIRVSIQNFASDVTFTIERQAVQARPISPVSSTFMVTMPSSEFGFTNLRIRSGGVESDPVQLRLTPEDGSYNQTVIGRAFYQKIDVTDNGLDLTRPYMVPIRHARVEVVSSFVASRNFSVGNR